MNDRPGARLHRVSPGDRQMLAAAYLPVIAFAAVLVAARMPRTRQPQHQTVLR